MITIAIIEDEKSASDALDACIKRYSELSGESFDISFFYNGLDFLTNYQAIYDIIFMDIEMPHLNGMETARKLRKIDDSTILIFITNLTQYAIKGYEVDAMDYILKPLNYSAFALKIEKAIVHCKKHKDDKIRISTRSGDVCFRASSIIYVESNGHRIMFHTETGDIAGYGTLKQVEQMLPMESFFRCNSCYILNLSFVTGYDGYEVMLRDEKLIISRARKKQFKEELHRYYLSRGRM